MDKMVIIGGERLKGEVEICGSKNSALALMPAALLAAGESRLVNIPALRDVSTMAQVLQTLGVEVKLGKRTARLNTAKIDSFTAPYDLVRTMRASVLVLGPLLARFGEARVSLPGGCAIGARPINIHLRGLEELGARISIDQGYINARAKRLKGCRIYLDFASVGATENIMMAATLAKGTTTIENAAREPEIVDLANFLNKMGAKIQGAGSDVIKIKGVESLSGGEHTIIPDRIEAGTYIVAGAITKGEIKLKNVILEHLKAFVTKMEEAGVKIVEEDGGIRVLVPGRTKAVDIKTLPYPGFPTDMQAQMMALMAVTTGISVITETVFENRFMHVSELCRMGADIKIEGHSAVVRGVPKLCGAPVMATDLRASAALVLAGLVAEGETQVLRIYHLDRGYEELEKKLSLLGANIKRVAE